jgi:hypothetical protein
MSCVGAALGTHPVIKALPGTLVVLGSRRRRRAVEARFAFSTRACSMAWISRCPLTRVQIERSFAPIHL